MERLQLKNTPLTLYRGKAFGKVRWYQVQSYCGDFTPKFVTKEMGWRNLEIGCCGDYKPLPTDIPFTPWEFAWTKTLSKAIGESDLPYNFANFSQQLSLITAQSAGQAMFMSERPEMGQASGFIRVNGVIRHPDPVISLGMGLPMLMKLQDQGSIDHADGIDLTQAMVAAGITETITTDYYAKMREGNRRWPARFMWEAYHTTEVICRTF